jgi:cytochrome c biogenesis protein ResB
MSDMSEIVRLDQKIDQFMLSQDKHNESVVRNLEKLTDAMAIQQGQQVEINQVTSAVQRLSLKHDIFGTRLGHVETNQAVANEFRKDITQLKWVCVGAAASLVVGVMIMIVKSFVSA